MIRRPRGWCGGYGGFSNHRAYEKLINRINIL